MDDDSATLDAVAGGDTGTTVSLHAGFPNPAADRSHAPDGAGRSGAPLSLDKLLIKHPSSTYFFRLRGHQWENAGIFDGDIAVIDKALTPHEQDLVVWWQDSGEFYLTRWKRAKQQNIWGVVSSVIHPRKV